MRAKTARIRRAIQRHSFAARHRAALAADTSRYHGQDAVFWYIDGLRTDGMGAPRRLHEMHTTAAEAAAFLRNVLAELVRRRYAGDWVGHLQIWLRGLDQLAAVTETEEAATLLWRALSPGEPKDDEPLMGVLSEIHSAIRAGTYRGDGAEARDALVVTVQKRLHRAGGRPPSAIEGSVRPLQAVRPMRRQTRPARARERRANAPRVRSRDAPSLSDEPPPASEEPPLAPAGGIGNAERGKHAGAACADKAATAAIAAYAERIDAARKVAPCGELERTAIRDLFQRHVSRTNIEHALELLERTGRGRRFKRPSRGGRRPEVLAGPDASADGATSVLCLEVGSGRERAFENAEGPAGSDAIGRAGSDELDAGNAGRSESAAAENTGPLGQRSAQPGEPEFVTIDELAELLRVDRKTLYAAARRGEVEGVRRIGGVLRAHRETVLRWFAEGQGRVPRSRRSR